MGVKVLKTECEGDKMFRVTRQGGVASSSVVVRGKSERAVWYNQEEAKSKQVT
jgi:hypothetical protein